MHDDINCPYCNKGLGVCHDDGDGYKEGVAHEMECGHCDKTFVFTTVISFDYYAKKADCLNGNDHKLKPSRTVPREYTRMMCEDCDFERPCNKKEKKDLGYWE